MVTNKQYFYGTGRRKSAIARVRLYPGTGQIVVNGKAPEDYFGARAVYERTVTAPMRVTETMGRWNVMVKVTGGGVSGQAGAVSHGLARAWWSADREAYRGARKGGPADPRPARKGTQEGRPQARPQGPRSTPSGKTSRQWSVVSGQFIWGLTAPEPRGASRGGWCMHHPPVIVPDLGATTD